MAKPIATAMFWSEIRTMNRTTPTTAIVSVLAVEIGLCALLHGARDALHALVARRQSQQLARRDDAVDHAQAPAHTRATTTPWSVRKSLKGSSAKFFRWGSRPMADPAYGQDSTTPAKGRGIL